MKRLFFLPTVVLTLVVATLSQTPEPMVQLQQPSTPERLIREVYAKLAFANDVYVIEKTIPAGTVRPNPNLGQILESNQLTFELSDFKSGSLSDSVDTLGSLSTNLDGKPTLNAVVVTNNLNYEGKEHATETFASMLWTTGAGYSDGEHFPLRQLAAQTEWTQYVTYKVTATYQGKIQSYRAFSLTDGSGEHMETHDPYVGGLSNFVHTSVYPSILVKYLKNNPSIARWINEHTAAPSASTSGQLSCDLSKVKCLLPADDKIQEQGGGGDQCNDCGGGGGGGDLGCAAYSNVKTFSQPTLRGTAEHQGGSHSFSSSAYQSCIYSQGGPLGPDGEYPCQAWLTESFSSTLPIETGQLNYGREHSIVSSNIQAATSVFTFPAAPSATAKAGTAVNSCLYPLSCAAISIAWNGISFSYTPRNPFWSSEEQATGSCPALESLLPSPIVIDLDGNNFNDAFSDVAGGVVFDIYGLDNPIRLAWTRAGANVGFLALDRNGDGRISSGKELFGNYTDQPQTSDPNGFNALSVFDDNKDGVIDRNDSIWSQLRVWVDTCHCGDSRQGILYSLDDLEVSAIPLYHTADGREDSYGNQMRFRGVLRMQQQSRTIPTIYDVFFRK